MKTALVTGASRGIGKAISIELAKNGYNLHLACHKNIKTLENLKAELENNYKVSVNIYCGDISESNVVKNIFHNIDSLDILINNAGISHIGLLSEMTDKEWKETMSVNLDSVFYCSREAVKKMLKNHSGHIINISSVWGLCGASMEVAYSASKGAINAFTMALAKELAPSNISVNAIACGFIDTDMNKHLSKAEIEEIISTIPADRAGTPDDVAKTTISIINSSNYLTGQIIKLDGGWI